MRHGRLLSWGALAASRQACRRSGAPGLCRWRVSQQAPLPYRAAEEDSVGRRQRWRAATGQRSPPAGPACPGARTLPEPRLRTAEDEREKEASLAALPPGYYSPGFDTVAAELGRLRPAFTEAELEEVVEARAAALEVVSERLSAHVLARYDSFIAGVDEVRPGDVVSGA